MFSGRAAAPAQDGKKDDAEILSNAWIEVTKPKAYLIKEGGNLEIKTGDEIGKGSTVMTDAGGAAVLHFPDGSLLRLDGNTKIVLTESFFSNKVMDTKVGVRLLLGRVWSKVVSLASPESSWQVKSSSAVATVRGTAFSVEYRSGKTTILAVEHSIEVKAVNPKTDEVIETAKTLMVENQIIQISESAAQSIAENKSKPEEVMKVAPAGKDILESDWVKNSRKSGTETEAVEVRMKDLREKGKIEEEVRKEVREEIKAKREELRGELKPEDGDKEEANTKAETGTNTSESSGTRTGTGSISSPESSAETFKAVSITLEPVRGAQISERQTLTMTLYALDGQGAKRDVTKEAKWQVTGPIGQMKSAGVFLAALGDEVSEIGTGKGEIQALWNGLQSNVISITTLGFVDTTGDESTPISF